MTAGGIVLTVLGAVVAVAASIPTVQAIASGLAVLRGVALAGLLVTVVALLQVYSGSRAIQQRRGEGKVLGIVLASLGGASMLLLLFVALTYTEVSLVVDPFTLEPEVLEREKVNLPLLAVSLLGFAGYITAIVLLSIGRPQRDLTDEELLAKYGS